MSNIRPIYEFQRGETGVWFEEAMTGDPTLATGLVSKLKPISDPRAELPGEDVPAAATLAVTHTPAQGDIGPGWTVTMAGSISAGLPTGYYVGDIAFVFGGAPYVTSPVIIRILPAISLS